MRMAELSSRSLRTRFVDADPFERQGKSSFLADFKFSVEPYRGCGFGCNYCFVPAQRLEHSVPIQGAWGSWAIACSKEAVLRGIQQHRAEFVGAPLYMASNTDAWQPQEKKAKISRFVLEQLVQTEISFLLISTRSPMIGRDLDVLQSFKGRVAVGISVPTDLSDVLDIVEPRAPNFQHRIKTIQRLRKAGLHVRAHVAPLLPHSPLFIPMLLDEVDRIWIDGFDPSTPKREELFELLDWSQHLTLRAARMVHEENCRLFDEHRFGFGSSGFSNWPVPDLDQSRSSKPNMP